MNKKRLFAVLAVAVMLLCVLALSVWAEETTIPTITNPKTITYDGDVLVTYNEQSMTLREAMLATADAQLADDGETKKYPAETYPWAVFYKDSSNAIGWRLLKCCKYYLANNQNTASTADGAVNLNSNGLEAVILLRTKAYNMSSNVNDRYDNLVYNTCAYTVDLCGGTVTCTSTRTFFDMENKSNGGSQVARLMNGTVTDCTLGAVYLRGSSTKTKTSNHDFIFEKLTFNGKMGKLVNCTTSGTNLINHEVEIKNCTFDYSTFTTDIVLLSDSSVSSVKAYISGTKVIKRFTDTSFKLFDSIKNTLSETVGEPTFDYTYDHIDTDYDRVKYDKGTDIPAFALFEKVSGSWQFKKTFNRYYDNSNGTKDAVGTTVGVWNYARFLNESGRTDKAILLLRDYTNTEDPEQYDNLGQLKCNVIFDLNGHTIDMNNRSTNVLGFNTKSTATINVDFINGTITNMKGQIVKIVTQGSFVRTDGNTSDYYTIFKNSGKTVNLNFKNVNFENLNSSIALLNGCSVDGKVDESMRINNYGTFLNLKFDNCSITRGSGDTTGRVLIETNPTEGCEDGLTVSMTNTTVTSVNGKDTFASMEKPNISVTITDLAPQMALSLYDNIRPLFRVENGSFTDITLNYNGTDYAGVSGDTYTVFDKLPLVSPHLIGEKATVKVTATYLGTEVTSDVMEISIADYCYKAIRADITVVDLPEKKLIVDTLNYAAASQTWVAEQNGTPVGTLVNADLTNDEKALGTTTDVAINSTNINHTRDDNGTKVISAVCVSLNNGIRIKLTSNEYKLRVSCDKGEVGTISSFATDGKFYYAQLRVSAAELNVLYKFELLDAENNVVETFENYSFESYAYAVNKGEVAGTTDALKALVQAMMNYGKSAYDFANGGN